MTTHSDAALRNILQRTKTIAIVGVSVNPVRPSYFVARYLALKGFDVIPVNPAYAGQDAFGRTVLAELKDIDRPVDMLDIFRRSEHVPDVYAAARATLDGLKTVWMQIGVEHAGVAADAEQAGLAVVQNRCPKIEYQRLFGELRMGGFATGVISSKL